MALTGAHSATNYDTELSAFIESVEGSNSAIHHDGNFSLAIGRGYDLSSRKQTSKSQSGDDCISGNQDR